MALNRPAPPTISLASVPRGGVDTAARRRGGPSPKGRPGSPAQGGGGKVYAAPLAAATARVVVMRRPAPPSSPAQGRGGKVHAAAARVVMRGPTPPSSPVEGSGGKVHAAAAARVVMMRGPAPPGGGPAEGAGGHGGVVHTATS
ncbi:hypothetical protein HU200_055983 [Digitaria exilis]|uniref:Uncharacterized protein n=1 Tax=Digitaria exilis TaxID=1010633 RepID=A0A835E5B0_9POAL|nr:hypothetical protein HU200_055983 [Digitaria exilis]